MNSTNSTSNVPAGFPYYQPAAKAAPSISAAAPAPPATSINFQGTPAIYKVIDIGTQFCKQYYMMLSTEPQDGYKFYSKQSYMTHGEEGEMDAALCCGLDTIQQRILSMGFAGCRVFISTIDCQPSLNGSVILVVLGRMQMKGGESRKFMQSIFLAEQPTGFFVLNDVFRFIDTEEPHSPLQLKPSAPVTEKPAAVSQYVPAAAAPAPASPTAAPIAAPSTQTIAAPSTQFIPPPAPQTVKSPIQPPQAAAAAPTSDWSQSEWSMDDAKGQLWTNAVTPPTKPTAAPLKTTPQKAAQVLSETATTGLNSSSWAAITGDHQTKWGNGLVSDVKGTSIAATALNKNHESRQDSRSFKPRRHEGEPKKTFDGAVSSSPSATNEPSTASTGSAGNSSRHVRNRRPYNDNYNVEASIYIGGGVKTEGIKVDDLKAVFAPFGTIKDVDIARNALYIEFEQEESAKKAIAAGSVKLKDGQEARILKRRARQLNNSNTDSSNAANNAHNGNSNAAPQSQSSSRPNPRFTLNKRQ